VVSSASVVIVLPRLGYEKGDVSNGPKIALGDHQPGLHCDPKRTRANRKGIRGALGLLADNAWHPCRETSPHQPFGFAIGTGIAKHDFNMRQIGERAKAARNVVARFASRVHEKKRAIPSRIGRSWYWRANLDSIERRCTRDGDPTVEEHEFASSDE
jgi:hypothetical protein